MKGTVVVVLHKDGHLMGSGVCTEQDRSRDDDQTMVASHTAWGDALANCSHPDVARAVNQSRHLTYVVSGYLRNQCGWREHVQRFEIPEA